MEKEIGRCNNKRLSSSLIFKIQFRFKGLRVKGESEREGDIKTNIEIGRDRDKEREREKD
jgi:hypothetical protein